MSHVLRKIFSSCGQTLKAAHIKYRVNLFKKVEKVLATKPYKNTNTGRGLCPKGFQEFLFLAMILQHNVSKYVEFPF